MRSSDPVYPLKYNKIPPSSLITKQGRQARPQEILYFSILKADFVHTVTLSSAFLTELYNTSYTNFSIIKQKLIPIYTFVILWNLNISVSMGFS